MLTQQSFTLTETKLIAPAHWQLTLTGETSPSFAVGQFFLAHIADPTLASLRRAIFPVPTDNALRLHILADQTADPGIGWLVSRRAGETVNLLGALGNGFSLPAPAKNILLIGEPPHLPLLFHLANRAARRRKNVTLAIRVPSRRYLPSTAPLDPAVEVLMASRDGSAGYRGDIFSHLNDLPVWADAIAAVGNLQFYHTLKTELHRCRPAVSPGLAQALVTDAPLHICGTGVCGRCTVPTAHGTKLACAEGPVFDLAELLPEANDD